MPANSGHIFHCEPSVFTQNLNRLPHDFTHNLAGNPLFEISRLVDLADKVGDAK
jgi:hypothetical protein